MSDKNEDPRTAPRIANFSGQGRGPEWRVFKCDVKANARGEFPKDDRFSFWDVFEGNDEGGPAATAPALPAGAGQAAALAKRRRRQGAAFTWLYRLVEDRRLKEMLNDIDQESWRHQEVGAR